MFRGIPSDQIDAVWPEIKHLIAEACKGSGNYTADDIKWSVQKREMQLWVYGLEAVCVTAIANYPQKKRLRILIGTGKGRHNWQHHALTLEAWAREQGCTGGESIAREGWWRAVFRALGWRKTHIFIEKDFL